tara:strand:- start:998 stop:1348 length:351 start_codon:yes stop_codon:yes gene_type:complete
LLYFGRFASYTYKVVNYYYDRKEKDMNLTKEQQKYLLNKYKHYAYGNSYSVLIIENDCEVWRKDLTDDTSMHLLTDEEVSLLLALSPNTKINQTDYSEKCTERAETIRLYGYEPTY